MTKEMYDRQRDQLIQDIIEKYIADGLTESEALEKWQRYQLRFEPSYRHLKYEMLGVKEVK